MHEEIIAFDSEHSHSPFKVQMTGISYCDGSYRIIRNESPIYCIEYIIKGKGYVQLDNTSFCADEGDIYILPSGRNHYYYSDAENPWTKIWFNISGELAEKIIKCYRIDKMYHVSGLDLKEEFMRFYKTAESEKDNPNVFDRCALVFIEIVQSIAEYINPQRGAEALSPGELLKNKLDSLADFSVSYEKIMEGMYCTEHHAIRSFKSEYGITPYKYLLNRKLDAAKMLLDTADMSIKEIALFLGFNDNHYFSAFFKRCTGLSPKQYKNGGKNKFV